MMRRLKKLDREDSRLRAAGLDPLEQWRRGYAARLPRERDASSRRVSQRHPVVAAVLIAAAVTGVTIWRHGWDGAQSQSIAAERPDTMPPAGIEEQPTPIGSPKPAPTGVGGYRFERTEPDGITPVTWDPCRPIHYVLSGTAPTAEADVITSALTEIADLTGFRFIDDGTTVERATPRRPAYQPGRYGRRWAPVLIAWTTPSEIPELSGRTIGLGGATAFGIGAEQRAYVSGIVYLDKPQFVASLTRVQGRGDVHAMLRAVALHELGHLLGLAHVADPHSVMYPETSVTASHYSPGDRRGLYAESKGDCAPDL